MRQFSYICIVGVKNPKLKAIRIKNKNPMNVEIQPWPIFDIRNLIGYDCMHNQIPYLFL